MKFKNAIYTLIAIAGFSPAIAQTELASQDNKTNAESTTPEQKSSTTISGNADVYYKYDFSKTKLNTLTSFTGAHNAFELGMASVKIEHRISKVSMVADLGFGKRAQDFSYNDEGIVAAIKQLYITYAPATWIKFTMGSWATHVGYEVVDPYLNRNYSMSYMFTNGPFFHTGVKADITAGKHGFMIGIANPTDYKVVPDGMDKKYLLAQYSFSPSDKVKGYLNFVSGGFPDSFKNSQLDLVLTAKVSDKFSLGYNGTVSKTKLKEAGKYGDAKSWWGSALYINVDPSSWFGLCLREEYFSDKKMLKISSPFPEGAGILGSTLSANFKIGNLTIIPEFRVDHATKKLFTDKEGITNAKATAGNFLVAAVYQF